MPLNAFKCLGGLPRVWTAKNYYCEFPSTNKIDAGYLQYFVEVT